MGITTLEQVLLLPSVAYRRRNLLPESAGLYFAVVNDDYVAYVGISSTSIRQRWAGHDRKRSIRELGDVRIAFLVVTDRDMLRAMERSAIIALRPPLNRQHVPPDLTPAATLQVEDDGSPLVAAGVVLRELKMPNAALYRLVRQGRIPCHDVTKGWHKRKQIRFRVSEVRAALSDMDRRPRPPAAE